MNKLKNRCLQPVLLAVPLMAVTVWGPLLSVSVTAQQATVQQPDAPIRDEDRETNTKRKDSPGKLPRQGDSQMLDYLRLLLIDDSGLREKMAREAELNSKAELAAWLRSDLQVEPADVDDPLAPATALAEKKEWMAAADAYFAAFRINPDLFTFSSARDPIQCFRNAGRLIELARFFDAETLQKMDSHNHGMEPLFFALLSDRKTQPAGYELLQRVFQYKPYSSSLLLRKYPDRNFWEEVPDPVFLLRTVFIPNDFEKEGAGWERVWTGRLTNTRPLYHDPEALRQFADEIRGLLDENRRWDAGWALLAFFEAEIGNYHEAVNLLSERFVDANADTIPVEAAWTLGFALEGKDQELDQIVIKLLEPCLRKVVTKIIKKSTGPSGLQGSNTLRKSPIKILARLYAKNDRPLEARQLLYGLVDSTEQHPLVRGYVPGVNGWWCYNKGRCNECHSNEKHLRDFLAMTDAMTEIGYPVDSLLSLARIDKSFGNAFDSPRGWIDPSSTWGTRVKTLDSSLHDGFDEQKASAENAVTPRLVIEALKMDTFQRSLRVDEGKFGTVLDLIKTIEGDDETTVAMLELGGKLEAENSENEGAALDLMLSVRGEGADAKATVFSPVIDILTLAVNAQGPQRNKDIAVLDQELVNLSETEAGGIEAGIAATVFAFLRNDLNSAKDRMERLYAITDYPESDGAAFWLAARHALQHDQTRIIGAVLVERALTAAETQPDSGLKEAILRERSGLRTK